MNDAILKKAIELKKEIENREKAKQALKSVIDNYFQDPERYFVRIQIYAKNEGKNYLFDEREDLPQECLEIMIERVELQLAALKKQFDEL